MVYELEKLEYENVFFQHIKIKILLKTKIGEPRALGPIFRYPESHLQISTYDIFLMQSLTDKPLINIDFNLIFRKLKKNLKIL